MRAMHSTYVSVNIDGVCRLDGSEVKKKKQPNINTVMSDLSHNAKNGNIRAIKYITVQRGQGKKKKYGL